MLTLIGRIVGFLASESRNVSVKLQILHHPPQVVGGENIYLPWWEGNAEMFP